MAEALYRKYRPQVFDDVVGQSHIERTLKNAIDQDQVSHAYLFCGPRGTGKTTMARLLAKSLLCAKAPTSSPCGTCESCCDIASGTHPDVYELDAASRTGVDNVREEIISRVSYAPTRGTRKVYIIDEVHMLSVAAFNALLKTLEEPPGHVVFVLCTTDPQKVPETIQSRCQRFDFHRLSNDEIVSRMGAICVAEGVDFEPEALDLVAHRAEGGMRNALTSLEQLIAFGEGHVTLEGAEDLLGSMDSTDMAKIMDAVGRRDAAACFAWVAEYVESGADLAQFARDMAAHVRDLYVMGLAGDDVAVDVPEAMRKEMAGELALFGPDRLARLLGVLGDVISQLRTSSNPRLCFEIALTRMVRPASDLTLESLAERIEALERAGIGGAGAAPAAPAAPAQGAAPSAAAPAGMPASAAALAVPVVPSRPSQPASMPASIPASIPAPAMPAASAATSPVAAPSPAPVAPAQAPASPSVPAPHPAQSGEAAPAASEFSNPAALQRLWRSALNAIQKEKVQYGALFVNVKVRPAADGAGIVIAFPADNRFAFQMASKAEGRELLQRCVSATAGHPVALELVQQQAAAPSAAAPAASAPAVPAPAAAPAAPVSAPTPAAPVVSAPAAMPPASVAPVPASPARALDDSVPLDVYEAEGFGDAAGEAYDDVPFDPPYAAPSQAAAPAPVQGGAPAGADASASSAPAASSAQPESAEDLGRLLSDTIGSNIVFKEVSD